MYSLSRTCNLYLHTRVRCIHILRRWIIFLSLIAWHVFHIMPRIYVYFTTPSIPWPQLFMHDVYSSNSRYLRNVATKSIFVAAGNVTFLEQNKLYKASRNICILRFLSFYIFVVYLSFLYFITFMSYDFIWITTVSFTNFFFCFYTLFHLFSFCYSFSDWKQTHQNTPLLHGAVKFFF